jgi:hypothetical protein
MRKSKLFKAAVVLAVLLFAGGFVFAADVTITGTVGGHVSLSFGATTIGLGNLVSGVQSSDSVSITEQSNQAGYDVFVQSAQGFNLKLLDGTNYSTETGDTVLIPYTIAYGESGSLTNYSPTGTSPFQITTDGPKANQGITKEFHVYATSNNQDTAGNYQDDLTFTISNN